MYPQAEFPYERLVDENGARGRARAGVRARRHGRLRRRPLLGDHRRLREGRRRTTILRPSLASATPGPTTATIDVLPTLWFRNTWSWGTDRPRPSIRARRRRARRRARRPRHAVPLGDGRAASRSSARTRRTRRALFGRPDRDAVSRRTGSTTTSSTAPPRSTRTQTGHEGGVPLPARGRAAARPPTIELRLGEHAGGLGDDFDAGAWPRASAEADEFYAELTPAGASRRRGARAAPGARRDALVEAVLPLRRAALARRRPGRPAAAGRALERPQPRVDAPEQRRRRSRCPTRGSTRGTRPGTSPSTASRSRTSTRSSRRSSSSCSAASGTCTRTASSRRTSGRSATSTRRCTRGRRCACSRSTATSDYDFLERVLHKLLLNFTWWVNRKDAEGNNVFEGGFLGLDNIGPFDRSALPVQRARSSSPTARPGWRCTA